MADLHGLVLSLPTRNSAMRMRVWRALKETGCAVLRDGVYVLPPGAPGTAVLARLESEIRSADGFALTVDLTFKNTEELARARALFDRSSEYGRLVKEISAATGSLASLGPRRSQSTLRKLEREFDRLATIDFFPGQAKRQALDAMSKLRRGYQQAYGAGEPNPSRKRMRPLDQSRYRARTWTTRKDLWVDRLASAWLIKRFIDPQARFVWFDRPSARPRDAVGFDYDGAHFTHVGNRVTFEVLLTSFGLEGDPGLAALGAAVHFLDAGGIPVPDAKGLETMLRGAKEKARGDDALLAEAMRLLDLFYSGHTRELRTAAEGAAG
jgi:hypothetical protein